MICYKQSPSAVPRVELEGRIKSSLEATPTESELRRLLAQSKSDLAAVTAAHDSLLSDNATLVSDNATLVSDKNEMIDVIRRLRLENNRATGLLAAERARTAQFSAHLASNLYKLMRFPTLVYSRTDPGIFLCFYSGGSLPQFRF